MDPPARKRRRTLPSTDDCPFVPVFDKAPAKRTPEEIRAALEADAALALRHRHGRPPRNV